MPTRNNFDTLVTKANILFNDKYDYTHYKYNGMHHNGIIICPIHGEFKKTMHDHLNGQGCPKCAYEGKFISNEDFIERLIRIFGEGYDYSVTKYNGYDKKVEIRCKEHGIFTEYPRKLMSGHGCQECRKEQQRMVKESKFKNRLMKKYGDRYGLSKLHYTDYHTDVTLICNEHGEFQKTPSELMRGTKCPLCLTTKQQEEIGRKTKRRSKKYTVKELIQKFRRIHGDKYDYSNITEYHNNKQYIYPICKVHGKFRIQVCKHLQGQGCRTCAGVNIMTTERCIELSRQIHGDKYDYSRVVCNGRHKPIDIICPKHGVFTMTPHDHIGKKEGCKYCARERTSERCRLKQEEVIERIEVMHPEWIIDDKFKYEGMYKEVTIKCPKHDYFSQTPNAILWKGCGCPECNSYTLEVNVRNMLSKNDIEYVEHKTFDWLRYKRKQHLDFYLPYYNIGIECQGIQHFIPMGRYTKEEVDRNKERDENKWKLCMKNGVKLLYYANQGMDSLSDSKYMNLITDIDDLLLKIKNSSV